LFTGDADCGHASELSLDFCVTTVLDTLLHEHDLRFVLLAGVVCALAAFACISIVIHARPISGAMRTAWLAVAAISVGFGIWATHFIAMLSFDAGMAVGYDIALTLVSLVMAILICGAGVWLAGTNDTKHDAALGGAIVGLGISVMHYIGMTAMLVGGTIAWDPSAISASVLFGIGFGAAAFYFGTRKPGWGARLTGTGLLTAGICAMHFTAMGALGLENCFPIVSANDFSPAGMSLAVGMASVAILLLALGGVYLDLRDRRRTAREADRMRGLADAAVEGLLVCDGRRVITVNASFCRLVGLPPADIEGRDICAFISATANRAMNERGSAAVETELTDRHGAVIPVELIARRVDYAGKPHQAIAVRDLRGRKEAERHIRYLAHHDTMTGLPNRASFNARLDAAIAQADRSGQPFAVMCLDLDRFKEVNDLFGHAAGDALLQKVATALDTVLEPDQFAARLGGDEFVVILPDTNAMAQSGRFAEQLLDAFRNENERSSDGTVISASIGIAHYPEDAEDGEQLMNCADTALYRAKEDGRGIYRFFEARMGAELRDRRRLEHELRHAISRNELRLVYQPQVDITSGRVTGFEALLRWRHGVRGDIAPSEFIPVAEESGLIVQIGDWVLRSAAIEAAGWANPITIAVNVSPLQLHAPNFTHRVCDILFQTGLAPNRLELEVTESALIRDMNRALTTLRQLKAMGIKIAMDDFGTGYSSLSNLRAFPFDKIKVDRSFIKSVDSNEQSATIVRAVLGLGKGLKLPVLAEGVERPEELAEVCDAAQGFWLSRHAPIETFARVTSGVDSRLDTQDKVVPIIGRAGMSSAG
jgi:diguanylate cyclase (GGDEF)-like protein/PAS domain S-box-containing protein